MKIGWKHVLAWVVFTALIAFCYVALGGFALQTGSEIFGFTIPSGWGIAAIVALVLFSAFQAAVVVFVLSIFVLIFGKFQSMRGFE